MVSVVCLMSFAFCMLLLVLGFISAVSRCPDLLRVQLQASTRNQSYVKSENHNTVIIMKNLDDAFFMIPHDPRTILDLA